MGLFDKNIEKSSNNKFDSTQQQSITNSFLIRTLIIYK